MPVRFFSQSLPFKISKPKKIKSWILQTYENEHVNKNIDLNIVFCTDEELLEINQSYLNHDFYTDIITFPLDEDEKQLEAELYISLERVKENSNTLNVSFELELYRVIIHGVLHLCGYDDTDNHNKEIMRDKESYYLSKL